MPLHRFEFDVWQLVRIMVYLEEKALNSTLLKRWGEVWQELDGQLAELAEKDFEAFSDLMMNQSVVFEGVSATDLAETLSALDGVIVQMKGEQKQKQLDETQKNDLVFEIGELQSLRRRLKLLA